MVVLLLLLVDGQPDTERMTYVMMYNEKGRIVASRSSNDGKIELPDRDYCFIRVVQTEKTFTVFDQEYYNPAPTTIQRQSQSYPKRN